MSKYQRVIRAEIPSPNAVDNKSGQILDGRMLVIGSVGADKISVRELSDLIKAMGTLTTGTIHLGEANRSYIRLTAADGNPPRFEVRDPQGRYVVVFDANPTDGVTAALGVPDANGVHPLRIPADTGAVEIRTRAIVGMNETARTFVDAGLIDLLATGTASWDDVDATGIRLQADWGIASKEAGTQTVKWDAETGTIKVGQYDQVVLNEDGLVGVVQEDNPQGWRFREGTPAGAEMGAILATVDAVGQTPRDIDVNLYSKQPSEDYRANTSVWAFNPWGTGYALLQLSSYDTGGSNTSTAWLSAPTQVKLQSAAIELDGDVTIPGSYSLRATYGVIKGKLALSPEHVGMTTYAWEQTEIGTIAVVIDDTDTPYLRIKRQSIDGITVHEYIVALTEVEI